VRVLVAKTSTLRAWEKKEQRRAAIETVWLGSAIAFVPPAFVLAVGSAMIWAVRRFQ
jgi:hypothetical protein